ncbi:MAG TPA: cupin domain-containing protein [Actinoplanes sp.]|jgi:quercetin dioxygenase-like cupin family protein
MQKSSLNSLLDRHLATARAAASGRSAKTLYGGHQRSLRQTLITLTAGQRLDEHETPGEATVHVLHGRVRLATNDDETCDGVAGDLIVVSDCRHTLEALDDTAVILTVAKGNYGTQ